MSNKNNFMQPAAGGFRIENDVVFIYFFFRFHDRVVCTCFKFSTTTVVVE